MIKYLSITIILSFFFSTISIDIDNVYDFYSLFVRDFRGNQVSLNKYRGKVI